MARLQQQNNVNDNNNHNTNNMIQLYIIIIMIQSTRITIHIKGWALVNKYISVKLRLKATYNMTYINDGALGKMIEKFLG